MTPHDKTDSKHLNPRIPGRHGQQGPSLNTVDSTLNVEGVPSLPTQKKASRWIGIQAFHKGWGGLWVQLSGVLLKWFYNPAH